MKGDPGIGKSTLVKKIVYDWANDILQTFKLILWVSLKLLNPWETVENVITDECLGMLGMEHGVEAYHMRNILKQFGKQVLLILDGFDELAEGSRQSSHMKDIIEGTFSEELNLLLTSRPQMTGYIPQLNTFSTVARIEGFSEERARQFICKMFQDHENREILVNDIMEFLSAKTDIRNLSRSPLLLTFTCILVQWDYIDVKADNPMSFESFYEHLCDCILERYSQKSGNSLDATMKQDLLLRFGELALDCLRSGSINCKINVILNKIENAFDYDFITGENDRRIVCSISADDVLVSFVHRSLQEYLAARYVVNEIRYHGKKYEEIVPVSMQRETLGKYFLFSSLVDKMLKELLQRTPQPASADAFGNILVPKDKIVDERKALHKLAGKNFRGSTKVEIIGCEVIPTSVHFLTAVNGNNYAMVHLHLAELDLSNCLFELCQTKMPVLRHLEFSRCQFTETQETMQRYLCKGNPIPILQTVSFTECSFSSHHPTVILGKVFSRSGTLMEFRFSRCDLEHKLLPLLSEPLNMVQKLFFDSCILGEGLKDINTASIALRRLQEITMNKVQTQEGSCALIAKCISSSSRKVKLRIKCDRPSGLDPEFFCHKYPTLESLTVESPKPEVIVIYDSYPRKSPDRHDDLFRQPYTDVHTEGGGELPILKQLLISNIILCPAVMKGLAESLQCNHELVMISFKDCTLYDCFNFIGRYGAMTIDVMEFYSCSVVENQYDPALPVCVGALSGLKKLQCDSTMPSAAFGILVQCISNSIQLSSLSIYFNEITLAMLLDVGLSGLETLSVFVEETNSDLLKGPFNNPKNVEPFPQLRNISFIGRDKESSDLSKPLPKLSGPIWKQFLSCLSGHKELRKCGFSHINLTDTLTILLVKQLPSLTDLSFSQCKLSEENRDLEPYMGRLPAVELFSVFGKICDKPESCSYSKNNTFKLLFACLAGSENLRRVNIGLSEDSRFTNSSIVDQSTMCHDLTNCLSILFSKPLSMLWTVRFDYCTLSEDIRDLSAFEGNLHISKFDTMRSHFDNSALRLICACLSGCENLQELHFCQPPAMGNFLDMTNCLASLFKTPLKNLNLIYFEGCILDEDVESVNNELGLKPILPCITTIELSTDNIYQDKRYYHDDWHKRGKLITTTTKISNSAVCFICQAMAGSTELRSVVFDGYNISNCLSHLLNKPLPRVDSFFIQNCILNEDRLDSNALPLALPGNLNRVRSIDLSTCQVSNMAARVLCNAVSGSRYLEIFKVFDTDLTGCLPLLLKQPLSQNPNDARHSKPPCSLDLTELEVGGCSFNECEVSNIKRLRLSKLKALNLGHCQSVSGNAAQMLLDAVSENDILTSIVITDVDLSAEQPATYRFPILRSLSMEGCLFSKAQIHALTKAKCDGYLQSLEYLYLNRAKGLHGSFTLGQRQTGSDPEATGSFPEQDSFIRMCIGLLVLGVRGSDITQEDVRNLSEAISTKAVKNLRRLEINLGLCNPDVIAIFNHHNVRLVEVEAKQKHKLNPEQIEPQPCVQKFMKLH